MKVTRGEGGSHGSGAHSRAAWARSVIQSPRAAYPGVGLLVEVRPRVRRGGRREGAPRSATPSARSAGFLLKDAQEKRQ